MYSLSGGQKRVRDTAAVAVVSTREPVISGPDLSSTPLDVFKDVHTGLGTLGPPLHIAVNVKLNPKKFHCKVKQVTSVRHLLSSNGIFAHPDRVKAIVAMDPPQGNDGVPRFLGKFNYLSSFSPNIAEDEKPFTEVIHFNAVWSWSLQHDQAFKEAKQVIANAETLKFVDVKKPCVLQVDVRDKGLGGALLQDGYPMAFTSSTLSAPERSMLLSKKNVWPSK